MDPRLSQADEPLVAHQRRDELQLTSDAIRSFRTVVLFGQGSCPVKNVNIHRCRARVLALLSQGGFETPKSRKALSLGDNWPRCLKINDARLAEVPKWLRKWFVATFNCRPKRAEHRAFFSLLSLAAAYFPSIASKLRSSVEDERCSAELYERQEIGL